jgi:hypothetical protein
MHSLSRVDVTNKIWCECPYKVTTVISCLIIRIQCMERCPDQFWEYRPAGIFSGLYPDLDYVKS